MSMVHGIGGIFIQSKEPKALAGWYQANLDMEFEEHPDGGSYFIVYRTRDFHSSEVRENPVLAQLGLVDSYQRDFQADDGVRHSGWVISIKPWSASSPPVWPSKNARSPGREGNTDG